MGRNGGRGHGSHMAWRRIKEAQVSVGCAFEFCVSNEGRIVDVCDETIRTSLILICFAFRDDFVARGLGSRFCLIRVIGAKLIVYVVRSCICVLSGRIDVLYCLGRIVDSAASAGNWILTSRNL
ncbi:hypothetical protein CRG98_034644 [Punica granatum]|uniref:Uncharacterized protein n=1 Tax=Punica granatum TaxID=22663 RepID=A0A2I0ILS0_PUNGR|nr:hypothetical protein CRG98_034644 [Punica granatum]